MSGLLQDLQFGARMLFRNRGSTAAAALTLAVAVAALTTVFSLLNGVLLRPLPYAQADRIVVVNRASSRGTEPLTRQNFLDIQRQAASVRQLSVVESAAVTLGAIGTPRRLVARRVSPELFDLLGAQPALGRLFHSGERAILLSSALWDTAFARDSAILGRTVSIDGESYTVAGVLPSEFRFFQQADAFLPLQPATTAPAALVLARLAPEVTLQQANADLARIGANLQLRDSTFTAQNLQQTLVAGPRQDLPVLLAAAAFVLLIACANIAALALAKTAARAPEFSIRSSLGAARVRLLRQLLIENLLLALLAGALGLCLSWWAVTAVAKQIPPGVIPNPEAIRIDARVLLFTLSTCILAGLAFGFPPAWAATRRDLRYFDGRTPTARRGQARARSVLVVAELALSLISLSGAALMVRALSGAISDGAIDSPDRVLTLRAFLPPGAGQDAAGGMPFFDRLLAEAEALPGVESAAISTVRPFEGGAPAQAIDINGKRASAAVIAVSPAFFTTLGIQLKVGRGFTSTELPGSPPVAIVNETFARRFHLTAGTLRLESGAALEVIGTAPALAPLGRTEGEPPLIYVPFAQHPASEAALILRASSAAVPTLTEAAPTLLRNLHRDAPFTGVLTLAQLRHRRLAVPRLITAFVASFGLLALALALLGSYALVSHTVTARTLEFGIRAALGARRSDLYRLVGAQGLRLSLTGAVLGLAGAAAIARILRGVMFGVPVQDFLAVAATAVLLLAGTMAASFIPARRAACLDPAAALRGE